MARVSAIAVFCVLVHMTDAGIDDLQAEMARVDTGRLALLIFSMSVRATALAGFTGAVIYGVFNLGRAALDQATRFEKRLLASRLMHAMLARHDTNSQNRQPLTMEEVIQILTVWGESVESAYTHVRFGKRSNPVNLSVGADGGRYSEGEPKPRASGASGKEAD